MASSPLPGGLAEQSKRLDAQLRQDTNAPRRALTWLVYDAALTSPCPSTHPASNRGLLWYLCWTALSIDYCESCRGYLKTYDGEGSENVLLADWTSIHLDIIAQDRGLKRLAASLYEL